MGYDCDAQPSWHTGNFAGRERNQAKLPIAARLFVLGPFDLAATVVTGATQP